MPEDFLKRAKHFALKLINIRDRSEKELRERLELKNFSIEVIESTIEYLKDANLLDDRELALTIIDYCEKSKLMGVYGCRHYLKGRGIADEIIDELPLEIGREQKTAEILYEKKIRTLDKYEEQEKKRKLVSLFQRKGFHSDTIYSVLRERLNTDYTDL